MPNVAQLIKDHVSVEVKCVDRLYLNGYVPRLQSEGGVIGFLLAGRWFFRQYKINIFMVLHDACTRWGLPQGLLLGPGRPV